MLNTAGLISQFVNGEFCEFGSRPGLGLYGIKPKVYLKDQKAQKKWEDLPFRSSSSLKSRVVALRELSKGGLVSYGGRWKANKKTRVGVVSMGYADGFPRALGSNRKVLLRGKKRSVIGAVCMDFFMIELKEEDFSVALGEEVLIFEGLLSIEEAISSFKHYSL